MPDLGPHAVFIWAAYGVTFLAVAALVLVIVADDRRQRQILAELERQGITRRSAKPPAAPHGYACKPRCPSQSRPGESLGPEIQIMTDAAPRSSGGMGACVPLLVFAGLAGLFWFALHGGDPSRLPSALVGKPVPEFTLPPVEGLTADNGAARRASAPRISRPARPPSSMSGRPGACPATTSTLCSWSSPSSPGVRLYGINYKDDPAAARRFLGRYGNPFRASAPTARDASPSIGASMACRRPM